MSDGNGNGNANGSDPKTTGNGVGYCKPPVERQFGQPNGNPIAYGAPRGTKQPKKRLRNDLLRYLRDNPGAKRDVVLGLIEGCATGDGACQRIAWDRIDGPLEKTVNVNARLIAKVIIRGE